jgi:hypothetical protein
LRGTGAVGAITVVASVITRRVRVVIAVSVTSFGTSVSCAGGVSVRTSGATVLIGPAEPVTALTIAGALTICLRGAVVVAAISTSNDERVTTVGGFGFTAAIYFLGAGITVVSRVGPATGALAPSIGATIVVAAVRTSDLKRTGTITGGTQVTLVDLVGAGAVILVRIAAAFAPAVCLGRRATVRTPTVEAPVGTAILLCTGATGIVRELTSVAIMVGV